MDHKIIIGSDHRGLDLKLKLISFLKKTGYEVTDAGTNSNESCDYPDFALKVSEKVSDGTYSRGIVICGSGIGASIVVNKMKRIRAALCFNEYMAEMSKRHNNANVLALGARVTGEDVALAIVKRWFESEFEGLVL